jgi:hypothetical protein
MNLDPCHQVLPEVLVVRASFGPLLRPDILDEFVKFF